MSPDSLKAGWCLVFASLKVSGGGREALRLGADLAANERDVSVITMWRSPHALHSNFKTYALSNRVTDVKRALFDLPAIFIAFARLLRSAYFRAAPRFVFTHYATFPLALLVPRSRRFFFVQDFEWKFVQRPFLSWLTKKIILFFYRSGGLISSNAYLTLGLQRFGLKVVREIPIWADTLYEVESSVPRDIDYVMVLRKGGHKRLDLYISFIDLVRQHREHKLAVISPEDDIIDLVRDKVAVCLLRPSPQEMRALYARSKCFVHLSDHEGFGLPPLEAMGAGCVPLCRDSGGVQAYMTSDPLKSLLIPLDTGIEKIVSEAQKLVSDKERIGLLSEKARDAFRLGKVQFEHRQVNLKHFLYTD